MEVTALSSILGDSVSPPKQSVPVPFSTSIPPPPPRPESTPTARPADLLAWNWTQIYKARLENISETDSTAASSGQLLAWLPVLSSSFGQNPMQNETAWSHAWVHWSGGDPSSSCPGKDPGSPNTPRRVGPKQADAKLHGGGQILLWCLFFPCILGQLLQGQESRDYHQVISLVLEICACQWIHNIGLIFRVKMISKEGSILFF